MINRRPGSYTPYECRKPTTNPTSTHHYALTRRGVRRDVKKATTTTRPNTFTTVTMAPNDKRLQQQEGSRYYVFFWVCSLFFYQFFVLLSNNYLYTGYLKCKRWYNLKSLLRPFLYAFVVGSFFCFSLSCELINVFIRLGSFKNFNVCRKSKQGRNGQRNWNGCMPLLLWGVVKIRFGRLSFGRETGG